MGPNAMRRLPGVAPFYTHDSPGKFQNLATVMRFTFKSGVRGDEMLSFLVSAPGGGPQSFVACAPCERWTAPAVAVMSTMTRRNHGNRSEDGAGHLEPPLHA